MNIINILCKLNIYIYIIIYIIFYLINDLSVMICGQKAEILVAILLI